MCVCYSSRRRAVTGHEGPAVCVCFQSQVGGRTPSTSPCAHLSIESPTYCLYSSVRAHYRALLLLGRGSTRSKLRARWFHSRWIRPRWFRGMRAMVPSATRKPQLYHSYISDSSSTFQTGGPRCPECGGCGHGTRDTPTKVGGQRPRVLRVRWVRAKLEGTPVASDQFVQTPPRVRWVRTKGESQSQVI